MNCSGNCTGVLPPARLPFCHSPGQVRAAIRVTARGVDCAGVLPPARLPFCHSESPGRFLAAHRVTSRVGRAAAMVGAADRAASGRGPSVQ